MSRKDYVLIAGVIKDLSLTYGERALVAREMAKALKSTNSAFKPERFIEACGINLVDA